MDELTQNECIVSGLLYLILRLSSIVGTAPLTFKKRHNGCSISVSTALFYCDIVFGTILTIFSVMSVIINQCSYPEWSLPRTSTQIVSLVEVILQGAVICAATYTGRSRMKCLIEYLIQFQKINAKLKLSQQKPSSNRLRTVLVIGLLLLTIINICTGFFILLSQASYLEYTVFKIGIYAFWNFANIVVAIVFNQFAEIITAVLTSIQTFNLCLKVQLQELIDNAPDSLKLLKSNKEPHSDHKNGISDESDDGVINTKELTGGKKPPEAVQDTLRRFSIIYCYICDVVRKTNDSNGVMLVTLMMSLLFHLILTPYYIITILIKNPATISVGPAMLINWYIIHSGCLLMIVDPCHRTHEEMTLTKSLVDQMMYYTASKQDAVFYELKMLYRHLMLNDATYSPMQMFHMNRQLILGIVGSITTYLVIVIQL